jgi:EAL domain-containing protein (putative c-di-GMP-specific phosphodiesterase class I)
VGGKRTDAQVQVAELLRRAKGALELSVTFLTRMDGTTQTLEVVESSIPLLFRDGATQPQRTTFCQAILDGRLPAVIPDVSALPEAMQLPAARFPRIRSFVSVPVVLSDGSLYGTFCAASLQRDKGLSARDRALMEVLAQAAAVVIEPEVRREEERARIHGRLDPLMAAGGPQIVLQPIVDLATGARVGAEALSRFPAAWGMPPDRCFEEAHRVGEGTRLEVQALERAAATLVDVAGYVAMNVSPETLFDPQCQDLFAQLPGERVLLELSEHEPVEDYDRLAAVLEPLRDRGFRLAIDDVGSGFSSLRHIVVTGPDVIKLDRSIVAGVATDGVLHTLVGSLVAFAHGAGARVVAEGVETPGDDAVLRELGVDLGQGWFYGRPVPVDELVAADAAVAAIPAPRAPGGSVVPPDRAPAAGQRWG